MGDTKDIAAHAADLAEQMREQTEFLKLAVGNAVKTQAVFLLLGLSALLIGYDRGALGCLVLAVFAALNAFTVAVMMPKAMG